MVKPLLKRFHFIFGPLYLFSSWRVTVHDDELKALTSYIFSYYNIFNSLAKNCYPNLLGFKILSASNT